jgi:hypothetical protein
MFTLHIIYIYIYINIYIYIYPLCAAFGDGLAALLQHAVVVPHLQPVWGGRGHSEGGSE